MKDFLIEVGIKLKENLLSKKFWALVFATALLFAGQLDGGQWIIVAGVFIGSDAIQKAVASKYDV